AVNMCNIKYIFCLSSFSGVKPNRKSSGLKSTCFPIIFPHHLCISPLFFLHSPVQGNKRRPSQSAGTQWEAENRWGRGQSEVVFASSLNYSQFLLPVLQNWSEPAEDHLWVCCLHSIVLILLSLLENTIESIGSPEEIVKLKQSYGAWMVDLRNRTDEKIWIAEHFTGHIIKEYQDLNALWNGNYTTIELPWSYYGCGHAIYNNALYYQRVGRNIVVKYHFETGISKALFIENSWYYERMYLFSTSKSYFSIAVDENGLWVMYLSRPDEHIMVAEVDEETFSVLRHINTTYPQSKAGNAFVAGGVLYITDKNHMHVLDARFELKLSLSLEGFEQKVSPGSNTTLVPVLAMLSYNWLNKHLHTWEHGFLIQYPVHFLV
uniref:Gliomedin n=1 Tax=Naja naja TaxID=35670 RepID=A0A8C6YHT0_NAJNA